MSEAPKVNLFSILSKRDNKVEDLNPVVLNGDVELSEKIEKVNKTKRKDNREAALVERMYNKPEFCVITNAKENSCPLKNSGFDCKFCDEDRRKEFAGHYIETGGDILIPEITSIEAIAEGEKDLSQLTDDSSRKTISQDIVKFVDTEPPKKESIFEDDTDEIDPIDLSKNPILILDKRGILDICDNETAAFNKSEDLVISGQSEEILLYKPFKKIVRSTKVENL